MENENKNVEVDSTEPKKGKKLSEIILVVILLAILSGVVVFAAYKLGYDFVPCNYVPHFADESIDKPVIYLYPKEEKTAINVYLTFDGEFKTVYPQFSQSQVWKNQGTWRVFADPDGTIYYGDNTYNYLFWEGTPNTEYKIDTGYCVAKEDTVEFLETQLELLGLNDSERDDFITYWLPKLQENEYNVISFDLTYFNEAETLMTKPAPDTLIRVFMTYKGYDEPVDVKQPIQHLRKIRQGFTVVEWGGTQIE